MLVEQEQIVTPLDQMGNVTTLTLLGTTAPMLSTAITKGRLLLVPPVISVAPPCSSIPTPVSHLSLSSHFVSRKILQSKIDVLYRDFFGK